MAAGTPRSATVKEKSGPEGNRIELEQFAISPTGRTHDGTQRGYSTDEGQYGQAHDQKENSPDIMEDYMIHDEPLLFVNVFLSTQPSTGTDQGGLLYQPM